MNIRIIYFCVWKLVIDWITVKRKDFMRILTDSCKDIISYEMQWDNVKILHHDNNSFRRSLAKMIFMKKKHFHHMKRYHFQNFHQIFTFWDPLSGKKIFWKNIRDTKKMLENKIIYFKKIYIPWRSTNLLQSVF